MGVSSRELTFNDMTIALLTMIRIGFGEIEPVFRDDQTEMFRLAMTSEWAFMLLLVTFIIGFSLIIMNLLISVLSSAYMEVIKTSELDWKKEMLLIMQHKYNEVDKINEWWEQPFKDRPVHTGMLGLFYTVFFTARAFSMKAYYYFSLLALDEWMWMRGVVPSGRNPNDHQRSSVIYMKMADKEKAQELLDVTLSDVEVCKHLYGEEGLYFPQKNTVLQESVRRAKLDLGHSAWAQDDDLAADQLKFHQRLSTVCADRKLPLSEAELKMFADGETRIEGVVTAMHEKMVEATTKMNASEMELKELKKAVLELKEAQTKAAAGSEAGAADARTASNQHGGGGSRPETPLSPRSTRSS